MTPLTWAALAGVFVVAALPDAAAVRTGDIALGGRLGVAGQGRRPDAARLAHAVRLATAAGAIAVLGLVAWRGGPALTVAAAVVLGVVALLLRDAAIARRQTARHRKLVTAVRVLAGELGAGARPDEALRAAAATGDHARALLGPAVEAQRAGGDTGTVLRASDDPGVRALGVAWRLGESTGAALAEIVDRVAADLAGHDTRRRAVAVAVAGPRSSAVLLAGLPAIGVALGAAMGARPLDFLLADPDGRLLCCGGVILDAAGVLWIRRIVSRVQR